MGTRAQQTTCSALFIPSYVDRLAKQGSGSYLSATTLLQEAYLEMSPKDGAIFPDGARFMGYAARGMRGLMIEHARRRSAQKRGGRFEITSAGGDIQNRPDHHELTRISDALDELAKSDAALAEIVDLKFFCGLYSPRSQPWERTAQRQWEKARSYLHPAIPTDLES